MPDTETLTPDQVAEIEARKPFQYGTMVSLTVAQRDALCRSLKAAWAERNEAYVSERENCNMLEQLNVQLTTGLVNIYHVITGEHCKHGVALGMATSAVSSLLSENAALRTQNQTQAESITYFQENEKSLKAQLVQVEQERNDARHGLARRCTHPNTYPLGAASRRCHDCGLEILP